MDVFSSPGADEEQVLFCDGCDGEFHLCCATPPLLSTPPRRLVQCNATTMKLILTLNDKQQKAQASESANHVSS